MVATSWNVVVMIDRQHAIIYGARLGVGHEKIYCGSLAV